MVDSQSVTSAEATSTSGLAQSVVGGAAARQCLGAGRGEGWVVVGLPR
jgi:hypothetical protein